VAVNESISSKLSDAARAFQMSRQLKPHSYINYKIISAIESASCGDEVYQIANTLVNNPTLNNIRPKQEQKSNMLITTLMLLATVKKVLPRSLKIPSPYTK